MTSLSPAMDATGQSDALLREQYMSLRRQIPLMYLLMSINVAFLAIVASRTVPAAISLGLPSLLLLLVAVRAGVWLVRRQRTVSVKDMRKHLRGTLLAATVLSLLFGCWGLLLFGEVDPVRSSSIALYTFVGSIACCYCLQALPEAARLVLLFGAAPVTIRLLLSGDWYLVGTGLTFLLVAAVILRTLATNRSAFSELLRSRSEMSALVAALQQSQEHYRFSVDLNPQIPWISDPDGHICELSPRWTMLTGLSISESLGTGWTRAVHPDDLPQVLERWTRALQGGPSAVVDLRYRLRLAHGAYRWVRARSYPRVDAQGRIVKWYGNLEDIDEQVAAESALKESEERYRLASRATNDLIWDWSHATDKIEWADGVERVLGYTEGLRNTPNWWVELVHPEDRPEMDAMCNRVIDGTDDSWSHECRFRTADGSYVHLLSRGYVVRDGRGRPKRSVGALLDITQEKRAEEDLRRAAYHDPLTGLPNRARFAEQLGQALAAARQGDRRVGVVVIDVDNFKAINDSMGHAAGDTVLRSVGARIAAELPPGAMAARLGGDEFALVLPDVGPEGCADRVAQLLDAVSRPVGIDEGVVEIGISAGAAIWPVDGADAEAVLKSADLALYAAKADGAGKLESFRPEMRAAVELRKGMLRDARAALADDRVIPFYQPKIALGSGEVVGFEALLRWHHPERGLQPPQAIQAAFEDSALSTLLTDRMLDRVLADIAAWSSAGQPIGRIAINGSPADFRRGDFAERMLGRLHRLGLPSALLELEVTETVFLGQVADTVERALSTLRAEGVTIALDDFGTGYASLTHLQQFPVDVLKIDRAFVSRLDSDNSADIAIVHGIIDIARRMDVRTVAEGVENPAQLERLRELGCDIAQGYLFGRALSAQRVASFLEGWPHLKQDVGGWDAQPGLPHAPDRARGGR
ncbi:putative bifunctional diguanylate cyclase/phosphodiesterase [Novosphingobium soli]|uniref:putative bifunctional diguanylate cyclase/phosphodiesterase n=1 Tax=Novosphingobium soli TaxID=574956 RepID=UPI0036D3289C